MRLFLIGLWMLMAIATGYAMFHVNYQVEALKAEVETLRDTELHERESIHILEAEWAYLSRPDRIAALAKQFLPDFAPASATQITTVAALPYPPDPAQPPAVSGKPPATPAPRQNGPLAAASRNGAVLLPAKTTAPGRAQ
ncbi:MAG: hypothetical protein AB7G39_12415 [Alphaproteobacteria bacterium]